MKLALRIAQGVSGHVTSWQPVSWRLAKVINWAVAYSIANAVLAVAPLKRTGLSLVGPTRAVLRTLHDTQL